MGYFYDYYKRPVDWNFSAIPILFGYVDYYEKEITLVSLSGQTSKEQGGSSFCK